MSLRLAQALLEVFEASYIPATMESSIIRFIFMPTLLLSEFHTTFDKIFLAEFCIAIWKTLTLWVSRNGKFVDDLIREIINIMEPQGIHRYNDGEIMKFFTTKSIVDQRHPRLSWGILKFVNGLPNIFKEDEYDDIAGLEPLHVLDLKKTKKRTFFQPYSLLESIVSLINNDEYDEELIDSTKSLPILDCLLNDLLIHQSSAATANQGIIDSIFDKMELNDILCLKRPNFFETKETDTLLGTSLALKIVLQTNIGVNFDNIDDLIDDILRAAALNPSTVWSQIPELICPIILSCLDQDWITINQHEDILQKMTKVISFFKTFLKYHFRYFLLDYLTVQWNMLKHS